MDHPYIMVPSFDGKRDSFLDFEEKVSIWRNISPLPPEQNAYHLLLHMSDAARKVCLSVGKDAVGSSDGVEAIMEILRNRFAPDKVDCVFQDIYKFSNFKRTTQDMDTYLLDFEMLRHRAEARFDMGTGFPDEFVSVLCITNASLSKNEKRLVIASVGSSLSFGNVAAQMRRLFGHMGSSQNMDALVAREEEDFDAWLAFRKAKRAKGNSGVSVPRESAPTNGRGKSKNVMNHRTGEVNRCFVCKSEYHYAHNCPRKGKLPLKPHSSITLDHQGNASHAQSIAQSPLDRTNENSFSTTIDLGGEFAVSSASSVVVLDTGATANLVCKSWLANHNLFLERRGMEKVRLYPSAARFKFGDGQIGEVVLRLILLSVLQGVREPSPLLLRMLKSLPYCVKVRWKLWVLNWILQMILCGWGDTGFVSPLA